MKQQLSSLEMRLVYAREMFGDDFINFTETAPKWSVEYLNEIIQAASCHNFSYPPCQGLPELLSEIIYRENSKYGLSLKSNHILVTNGALHGLFHVFKSVLHPGDAVLCQSPIFSSIARQIEDMDCEIIHFDATLEVDAIKNYFNNKNIKLIYINIPHNPTGMVLTQNFLNELLAQSHEHNCKVVVDLVYDDFLFDNSTISHPLKLQLDWTNLYTVNSVSKNYGAASLRVGWIISDHHNIMQLTQNIEKECIAVSAQAQMIAAHLIAADNQPLKANVLQARTLLDAYLVNSDFSLIYGKPQGGTFCLVRTPGSYFDFADLLLKEYRVVITGSDNYVGCYQDCMRISYAYPVEMLDRVFQCFLKASEDVSLTL